MSTGKQKPRDAGAVLVFALLILVTGALVLGGLAQLAATQSLVGGREWEEARERVTLANSRAMARQFLLERIFSNGASGPLNTNSVTNVVFTNSSFGGFRLNELVMGEDALGNVGSYDFWSAYLSTSPVTGLNINPFNILERGGFYPAMIRAEVSDGSTNTNWANWNFQVRTRNPVAAGYSVAWHLPDSQNVVDATNRIVFLEVANGVPRTIVTAFSNLPVLPFISVTNDGAVYADGDFGELRVPSRELFNVLPASNWRFITNAAGSDATVEVSLSNISTPPTEPLLYNVPAATIPSAEEDELPVVKLRIVGEPVPSRGDPAVLISSPESNTNLRQIELVGGTNFRRLYLNIKQNNMASSEIQFNWTPSSVWRLGVSLEMMGAGYVNTLNLGGDPITVVGGFRINAEGLSSIPNVTFVREVDPGALDFIADQMMWLEDYRAP